MSSQSSDKESVEKLNESEIIPQYVLIDVSDKYNGIKNFMMLNTSKEYDENDLIKRIEKKYPDNMKEKIKEMEFCLKDDIFGRIVFLYRVKV